MDIPHRGEKMQASATRMEESQQKKGFIKISGRQAVGADAKQKGTYDNGWGGKNTRVVKGHPKIDQRHEAQERKGAHKTFKDRARKQGETQKLPRPRKRQPRKKPQKSISRSEKGRMGQGSSNWTSKTSEGIPTHLIDGVLFAFPQRVGVVGRGDGGSRGDGGERRGGGCGRKLKERAHRRRIGQERGREGGKEGGGEGRLVRGRV